ncbi:acetate/propionate family kinase [Chitinophaga cymbidii]|uniref:Acetate kinase n=1 Tax=Chitinophaga cymbidii TaxID=1096750 RepID=A0A512RQW8_9BACT|nr:acetate/propionate family kinase [Chitinophaga cymbidii]GEP98064.1 acetate kinase [Chitinophaga cymbidii]
MDLKPKMIFAVNCGSSSLKCAAFLLEEGALQERYRFVVKDLATPEVEVRDPRTGNVIRIISRETDLVEALDEILDFLEEEGLLSAIACIGHRMVHGGVHTAPVHAGPDILEELEQYAGAAPLHNPPAMACIRYLSERLPDVDQVICFDTQFHHEMPALSSRIPISAKLTNGFIKKYGFHGLSCESVLRQLKETRPELADKKIIIAHLGNGCSLTSVVQGKSTDNTMGFTPFGGIVMSSRPGDLDPGVLFYLLKERKASVEEMEELLQRESGLKALHGKTGDLSELVKESERDAGADFAVEYFVKSVCAAIASLTAGMGGIDALIFTGGIGENNTEVRRRIAVRMGWMGFTLNEKQNARHNDSISETGAPVYIGIIRTDEEKIIAEQSFKKNTG